MKDGTTVLWIFEIALFPITILGARLFYNHFDTGIRSTAFRLLLGVSFLLLGLCSCFLVLGDAFSSGEIVSNGRYHMHIVLEESPVLFWLTTLVIYAASLFFSTLGVAQLRSIMLDLRKRSS